MEAHRVDLIEDEEEQEEREINIVIDLSWNPRGEQSQEKIEVCDSTDRLVPTRDMKCQLEIDLNINLVAQQDIEYPVSPILGRDFHVPTDTAMKEEYESSMEATFDKYIDWGHGTLDFMPDGRLTFYEESNSAARDNDYSVGVEVVDQYDYRDFDLNSVLHDVQSREDDVRTDDMQAPTPTAANNNESDYHPEDDYIPLWLF